MSFVRKSFLAVMLLVSLLLLAACGGSSGENQVKSSGVLRVGTEGVYSPFSYHDAATNELVGYDVDVAKAVADKLGGEGPTRRGDRRSQGGPDEAVPRPNPQPAVERSI